MKSRVSLTKEDRIVDLYRQGYSREEIARIVNVKSGSTVSSVLRRYRRRWLYADDPHLGRQRNFLDDQQIEDIRRRHAAGETLHSIGQDYQVQGNTVIWKIVNNWTYQFREDDGFPFDFTNPLMHRRRPD